MSPTQSLRVDDELALVPRRADDASEMFALVARYRADLREWLTWIDATRSVAEVRRYAQFARAQFESHTAFDFAIRANGELVGSVGLHGLDWASRNAQIGYWLSPQARGRGIITRAVETVTAHALTRLGLHRVEIRCVVDNARSRAVPERLGFVFEGILAEAYLLHGSFRDIALYATTATRLTATRPEPAT